MKSFVSGVENTGGDDGILDRQSEGQERRVNDLEGVICLLLRLYYIYPARGSFGK